MKTLKLPITNGTFSASDVTVSGTNDSTTHNVYVAFTQADSGYVAIQYKVSGSNNWQPMGKVDLTGTEVATFKVSGIITDWRFVVAGASGTGSIEVTDSEKLEDIHPLSFYGETGGMSPAEIGDAIKTFRSFNNTGAWSTATAYDVNDLWSDSGTWYIVLEAYTSGASAAADIAGGTVAEYDISKTVRSATSIAEMQALVGLVIGQSVNMNDGGRSGIFDLVAGDFTAEVAADGLQGIHIAMADDPTGATKCLVRRLNGFVTPQMFGATGGNDSAAYQAAIDFASTYAYPVEVVGLDSTFDVTVEFKAGTILRATESSITVDGDAVKVAFTTEAHCASDISAFAENVHISGMKFVNLAELPSGTAFVTWIAWRAVNVRKWSMRDCEFENMGGAYVTHYIRWFGGYTAALGTNPNEATDPAVTEGMSPTGGDLNEDLYFCNNKCTVPPRQTDGFKTILQAFRHEFCERVRIIDNVTVRGAISGWGGSAIPAEGGDLQHYRRCRDVVARGNDLTEPNALYWIQGYNVKATENTVRRGIDLGIDFEGSVHCHAFGNFIYTSGNGSLATFYHSKQVVFNDNVCYEDESAKNINDEFNLSTKWNPSNGDTFYLNTGSHDPEEGDDEVIVRDNVFVWGKSTGSGIVDVRDATFIDFTGNTLFNVCFDSAFNNQGRVSVTENKFNFTQDSLRDKLVSIGDNETGKYAPEYRDNYMYLYAAQSLPCYCVHFFQTDNDNYFTEVSGNRFLHEGTGRMTSADVALLNESVNAGRFHTYHFENNVWGPGQKIVDLSTRGAAHVLSLGNDNTVFTQSGNTVDYGTERAGYPAFTDGTIPTGFGYLTGQKLMYADMRAESYAGIIAAANGWDLPASAQWAATTAYSVGDVVYTTGDNVYFCTVAGTSGASEPAGSAPTDGTVTWSRVGNFMIWKEYAALGATVQRS